MTRPSGVFSFAPLQIVLEHRLPEIVVIDEHGHPYFIAAGDQVRSAEVLGVSRRAVNRWVNGQLLRPEMADHCATRLGLWPNQLWDDWDEVHERIEADRQASYQRSLARSRETNRAWRERHTAVA